jgi:hypothetical protein
MVNKLLLSALFDWALLCELHSVGKLPKGACDQIMAWNVSCTIYGRLWVAHCSGRSCPRRGSRTLGSSFVEVVSWELSKFAIQETILARLGPEGLNCPEN